jgi:hypothetical protein
LPPSSRRRIWNSLIRHISAGFRIQLVLQPLSRQQQTREPRATDRIWIIRAMPLKLTARLAQPPLPPLGARDDPLLIELELDRRAALLLRWLPVILAAGELLLGPAQKLTPSFRSAQILRQLITPRLPEPLILTLVSRAYLGHDLRGDLLTLTCLIRVSVTRQARAVDRDQPRLDQPRLITQPKHLRKQRRQRPLVTHHEARDRRVIRHHVASNHPVSDSLATVTLDLPRGPHPSRVRVHQQAITDGSYAPRPCPSAR